MSELKVDTIVNLAGTGKPNLPVSPTLGGTALSSANTYSYTSSGTQPSSPKNGAIWWDSSNNEVYLYIAGEFKKVTLNASAASGIAWGGNRALVTGGAGVHIDYFDMTGTSNAADFGDLSGAYNSNDRGVSNTSRAIFTRNVNDSMDYVTIATPGNGTDFGDLIHTDRGQAPCSDGTYGVFGGGYGTLNSSGGYQNSIFYVTIANTGNATDFGDRTVTGGYASGTGNATRGLFFGVFTNTSPSTSNVIDYVTIASPGNATDFGDLSNPSGFNAAASDATRAVCATGLDSVASTIRNNIDYVTVASTGNATDFGDLTVAKEDSSACGNGTRIIFNGGSTGSNVDTVEYITVQTPGNATDLLDLTTASNRTTSCAGNAS